jgi:sulfur-carrier protein
MSVKVLIPAPLQQFTQNQPSLECHGSTIAELITELIEFMKQDCPGIKARLCDAEGKPRRFLKLYVNDENIDFLEGTQTILKEGDRVTIVPVVVSS